MVADRMRRTLASAVPPGSKGPASARFGRSRVPRMSDDELRRQARKRLEAKVGFWQYVGIWAAVTIVLIVIWLLTGGGYFWPMWPIFGMGIAAVFIFFAAYGPGRSYITEDRIDAEVRRMTGR